MQPAANAHVAALTAAAPSHRLESSCLNFGSKRNTPPLEGLYQYYIVLIHTVECFGLQSNRASYLRLKLRHRGRLLIEQAFHHVLMRQYQELTARKLSALSHYLAKNLITHSLRSLAEAAPLTAAARLAQQMFQTLARSFASHLDDAERRQTHHLSCRTITRERTLESCEHRLAMRLV